MQRIAQRDQQALRLLYDRYATMVYSLAQRILQNAGWAEEVTQDTFLKVWRQSESWDASKGQLLAWLLTITRYTAIDLLRRERRRPPLALLDPELPFGADDNVPDGELLRALLRQLPHEQAQVIELGFYGGMTHSEMAQSLGLPLGTVKTRVRLGLQKLRDMWLETEANPRRDLS